MSEQRFYYRTQDNKGFLNLKHQLSTKEINQHGYVQITREEFDRLTIPEPKESDE